MTSPLMLWCVFLLGLASLTLQQPVSTYWQRMRSGYFCIENYDPAVKKKKQCKFGTGGFTPSSCIQLGGCFPPGSHGAPGTGAYTFSADRVGNIWLDTWNSSTVCLGTPKKSELKTYSYFCVNLTSTVLSTLLVYEAIPNYGTGTMVQTTYVGAGCNGPAISVTITSPATIKAQAPPLPVRCKQVKCAAVVGNALQSVDSICTIKPITAAAMRGVEAASMTTAVAAIVAVVCVTMLLMW